MTHPLVLLGFEQLQSLDLVGPYEVFNEANHHLMQGGQPARYQLSIRSLTGQFRTGSGLSFAAETLGPPVTTGTLLIPGGEGARPGRQPEALMRWLAQARPERLVTVCSGPFLAAEAGLIRGRKVATHWSRCAELARYAPDLTVLAEPVYVRDGNLWSSAGVTAGMDLALAIVAEDCGPEVAQAVARQLVLYLHRPGNQSQFAGPIWSQRASDPPLVKVQHWLDTHPDADHRVESLARLAGMSSRHFQRRFSAQIGRSVGQYSTAIRLETAKRLLTQSDSPLPTVARKSGFGTAESLRRAMIADCETTPSDYRRRFSTTS